MCAAPCAVCDSCLVLGIGSDGAEVLVLVCSEAAATITQGLRVDRKEQLAAALHRLPGLGTAGSPELRQALPASLARRMRVGVLPHTVEVANPLKTRQVRLPWPGWSESLQCEAALAPVLADAASAGGAPSPPTYARRMLAWSAC